MKTIHAALFSVALLGCDAFDEQRLATLRHASSPPARDASTPDDDDREQTPLDAATPSIVDEPSERPPVLETPMHDAAPDLPEKEDPMCDDEDGGVPEDRDEDGVLDCADACPLDPAKTSAGLCGCNHPDDDVDGIVSCRGLRGALAHRFTFAGTGATLHDDHGNASGTLHDAELTGDGALALAGGDSEPHADLSNGLISGFTNVTVEAWVTWTGTESWQRIFDFGDSSGVEGESDIGSTYLMLSPRINDRAFGAAFANAGPNSAVFVEGATELPAGALQHVALVFDDSNDQLRLYLNGRRAGSALVTGSLSEIRDINNWLGRSQYKSDTAFSGALHELRIYGRALSDEQLMLSYASGTDPDFLSD